MSLFALMGAQPPRLPFTDWLSQVDRIMTKRGNVMALPRESWQAMYDVGLSPREVADDFA